VRLPTTIARGFQSPCVLSAMGTFAEQKLEKISITDMVQMAKHPPEERARQLHETLRVGLARSAIRLAEMPFGFGNAPSIKRVTAAYVQNFQQVIEYEARGGRQGYASKEYTELTQNIFNQHRGTMLDVAKGVFEFYEDLRGLFGEDLQLSEVREDLKLIREVESCLDEFFTNRLTLRLLMSHVNKLSTGPSVNEDMVGIVNVNTQPIAILSRAFSAARFMCLRDFSMAPDLYVNGIPHLDYVARESSERQHFAYVHTHLFYIFLELVKNAARASIERAQSEATGADFDIDMPDIPRLNVFVPEEQTMWDQERSVKLADKGTGMTRQVLAQALSYFYSSVKSRPTVADEVSDFDRRVPLAGFGFGLPISRVMARYFSGDIDLNSIPGRGTDVYMYL